MEEYEKLRNDYRVLLFECILAVATITIIVLIMFGSFHLALFVGMMGTVIVLIPITKAKNKYRDAYKKSFVYDVIRANFEDAYYDPNGGISDYALKNTDMIYTGDVYKCEDYISGIYKGVKFEQSDVHIQEVHHNGKSTSYVTIFKGRWLIYDYNKYFKYNFMVSEKGFRLNKAKRFLARFTSDFKKVMMESQAFNEKFDVYAQNDHEAFYVLTPVVMERFLGLESENKGRIAFFFHNGRILIGLDNRENSFEPIDPRFYVSEESIKSKVQSEVDVIKYFIDSLELDDDLFI